MRRKIVKNTIAQRILRDVPKNHFTPRSYEWELLHAALSNDTILCCGNNDAKSFITLCLFKEKMYQLADKFSYSVYLSDNISTLEWTAQFMRQQLLVPIHLITDLPSADRWLRTERPHGVLCLTPACLHALLFERKALRLSEFNTMILDHCHVILNESGHPYGAIMAEFGAAKRRDAKVPQVLAFTDALYDLKSNDPDEMEERFTQLERSLHCRAETASELLNIFVYGVRPREFVLEYLPYDNQTSIGQFMQDTLKSTLDFLEDIDGKMTFTNRSGVEVDVLQYVTRAVQECKTTLRELGPFCCSTVARVFMKHLLASEHQCYEEMVRRLMRYVITQFGLIIRFFRSYYDNILTLDEFSTLIPDKVQLLVKKIKDYHPRVQFTIEVDESSPQESQDSDFDSDLDLDDDVEEEEEQRSARGRGYRRRRGRGSRSASRSSAGSRASVSNQMNYRAVLMESSVEPDEDKFSALVLVGSQFTAYALSRLLDELCIWDCDLYYVKPGHFYGPSRQQREAQQRRAAGPAAGGDEEEEEEAEGEEGDGGKAETAPARSSLLNRYQEETMRKFRMGHVNVLFATGLTGSTAEENNFCLQLDIPKCNLLLRFDPPPQSFVDYVYSKTRVKAERASYAFLVEQGPASDDFRDKYRSFQAVESVLVARCASRDSFDRQVTSDFEDGSDPGTGSAPSNRVLPSRLLPPFVVPGEDGAQLHMESAIGLVNRYCASLPSDVYSQLVPTWWLERPNGAGGEVQCHLRLPMNSPMTEEIVGDPMPNALMAKMAAALRCCAALYRTGELTPQLEPVGKEKQLQLLRTRSADGEPDRPREKEEKEKEEERKEDESPAKEEAEEEEEDEEECNEGMVSVKRRQFYYKKVADCLQSCFPEADRPCHLYLLHLRLTVPLPAEVARVNRDLFHYERADQCFGLLSRRPIRALPEFPVFTRSGEVGVALRLVSRDLTLGPDALRRLVDFHRLVFRRVLRLEKDAVMAFQCEQAYSQVVVVPLRADVDTLDAAIDWDFLAAVEEAEALPTPCKIPPRRFPDSGVFDFREEDYKDAIVMPTYRNFDQPQHYYVAEIRRDLSPKCSFPSDIFHTFEDYYCRKYNAKVTNADQPLLDVDFTVMRLNLVIPRHVNYHGHVLHQVSAESRRLRSESLNQKQLLLPELTYRHPVPASLWRKAVCLPTILYRANYLLLADELRRRVAAEARVGRDFHDDGPCPFEPMAFRYSSFSPAATAGTGEKEAAPRVGDAAGVADGWSLADSLSESKLITEEEISRRREAIEKARVAPDDDFGEFVAPSGEDRALEAAPEDGEGGEEAPRQNGDELFPGDEERLTDGEGSIDDDESVDSFEGEVTFFRESEELQTGAEFGPSPVALLEALTMSNANDFFNYERLETLGDSFLKFAVTVFYYCCSGAVHEGQLSRLRSRQVSNFNLYRLGRAKSLHEMMVGYKFEPAENWIPPGYVVHYDARLQESALPMICPPPSSPDDKKDSADGRHVRFGPAPPKGVPYYLRIQHSLPDKSVADCVEALVGCYLTSCGEVAALRVMKWLGIEVGAQGRDPDSGELLRYWWPQPPSPLLPPPSPATARRLEETLWGYDEFERVIQYRFQDRSYLLQAFTHASFTDNGLTDCYQKLEFLGDAILDYVVTRYLFEDSKNHSPGVLTDLRSALVNNHIFAGLAVKWGFHKFFRCYSPALWRLIQRFVEYQKVTQADDLDFITSETELYSGEDEREDVEIPKALGDIFESVAGAVYLDSGNCLDTVWRVFFRLMRERIERYTACIPKSPVRELLEMYPEATSFERPKRTSRGKICVCVRVVNRGRYYGIGRNYRIAKSAAAKRALSALKAHPIPPPQPPPAAPAPAPAGDHSDAEDSD